jgi:hypothetical protein
MDFQEDASTVFLGFDKDTGESCARIDPTEATGGKKLVGVQAHVPAHAGNVIRGKTHVSGATRAKAAQPGVAFKPEPGPGLDLFAKIFRIFLPCHAALPFFSTDTMTEKPPQ